MQNDGNFNFVPNQHPVGDEIQVVDNNKCWNICPQALHAATARVALELTLKPIGKSETFVSCGYKTFNSVEGERWIGHRHTRMRKRNNNAFPIAYSTLSGAIVSFAVVNKRRIATRYDRLAVNYLAFIKLASIRIWLLSI